MKDEPRLRSIPFTTIVLFTFVLSVYLQTFGGVFHSIDEEIYLRMTRSLVEGQSFAIAPMEGAPTFSVAPGLDGRMYANRNPALPIVAVPFYVLGRALTGLGSPHQEPTIDGIAHPTVFTLSLTLANTAIVAAIVALLFLVLSRLGYGRPVAAVVALLLAFGTMAWPYASKSFFAEPLLALCTLLSFYCALRYRQHGHPLLLVAAGGCAGWAILTKVTAFALVPLLAAYVLWPTTGRSWRWPAAGSRLAWLAAGVVPFVLALLVYNALRFGGPFLTGYELEGGGKPLTVEHLGQFLVGLYGLTLSAGKGLLIYAAPTLLGIWVFPRFWRAHQAEAVFIYGLSLASLAGTALWRDWSGGWCWGPRLVLHVVPLLLIPAATLLSPPCAGRRGVWGAIGGFGLLSSGVQLVGVLPNYLLWYDKIADNTLVYFSPMHSPIAGHWMAIVAGEIDLFWNKVALFFPQHVALFAGIRWAVLVVAVMSGWLLWWTLRAAPRAQGRPAGQGTAQRPGEAGHRHGARRR